MSEEKARAAIKVEKVLIGLLPDLDALKILVQDGMKDVVIPSEDLRPVYGWALNYYGASGKAPTPLALRTQFGEDFFSDREINLDDEPEESAEWVIETLKSNYVRTMSNRLAKDMVSEMRDVDPSDRLSVLSSLASRASALVLDLTPASQVGDLRETAIDILSRHDMRAAEGEGVRGMCLGLPEIDEHFGGIHPGEVAVLAAPPKTGKSFALSWAGLKNWEAGRPGAIFTLENSREMTEIRIACQALHIDYNKVEQGRLEPRERASLEEWIADVLLVSDVPLWIVDPDGTTPHSIMQQAFALDCEWVAIDQLTFVTPTKPRRDQARNQEIAQMMRDFKNLARRGARPIPVLLAHQINRAGIKNADKTGWLTMSDLAESSEVERASDFVFGLYGSSDMIRAGSVQFQTLASRRVQGKSYDLHWHPAIGGIGVQNEVTLND